MVSGQVGLLEECWLPLSDPTDSEPGQPARESGSRQWAWPEPEERLDSPTGPRPQDSMSAGPGGGEGWPAASPASAHSAPGVGGMSLLVCEGEAPGWVA